MITTTEKTMKKKPTLDKKKALKKPIEMENSVLNYTFCSNDFSLDKQQHQQQISIYTINLVCAIKMAHRYVSTKKKQQKKE